MPDAMKTHRELVTEARGLDQLGRRYWEEHRSRNEVSPASARMSAGLESRVLFRFPDTLTTATDGETGNSEEVETLRLARRIEVKLDGDRPEFLLVEEEYTADPGEGIERLHGPIPIIKSDDVLDALSEGYQLGEEDRIGALLAPFTDRIGEEDFIDDADSELVEKIASIVEVGELGPAARLRAKADIAAFLEGRLESSEFISAAIERQCHREEECQVLAKRHGERISITE